MGGSISAARKAGAWYNAERVKQPGSVVLNTWLAQRKSAQMTSLSFGTMDHEAIRRIFGGGSYTGRSVTDDFALAVSTVWRCVQLLSQTIGSLPWAVYERVSPGKSREASDHWLADVLVHSPNADMDRMQFREAKAANLVLRGAGYSLKEFRGDGTISSLYPMPTKDVRPERDRETGAMRYRYADRGKEEVYPSEKVWNVRSFSFDGRVGLPPLGFGRHAIALAAAAEEFGARFFANGARVSGTVKIPQWLDDEQRPKAQANLERIYTGLENAHKLMLLEGGMAYEQMSASPGEAQHNELRGFQIPDICRFFGVPPHLAFDLTNGSYNNVETLASEFVTFGLLPHLVRFELAAQKQLLRPEERRRYFVRFNFEGLLRANSLERAQFYAAMLQNGVFSRNEVREKENLDRIEEPGMDDRTVQTNLSLIQFLEAMVDAGKQSGRGNNPKGDDQ
jgi:HK97 family phage portal protein